MDSLLANYASSDEEDNKQYESPARESSRSHPSLFSSLPPPSRSFASLPPPKNSSSSLKTLNNDAEVQEPKSKPSSLFSSLPPPKPHNPAKRVIEFKPPINYALTHHDDDDDENPRPKKKASSNSDTSSSAGGLSAILPPPKNTPLGSGAAESGNVGRRSIVEIPSSVAVEPQPSTNESNSLENPQYTANYDYDAYSYNGNNYSVPSGVDPPQNMETWSQSHGNGSWDVGNSVTYESTISVLQDEEKEQDQGQFQGIGGRGKMEKRGGRNQIPCDIIEVKQDELMSNRPREDQAKLTGIAFGPSYKPASAAKDKPSKLHKRKHQIGSLYYEIKQKEMELAERRARGQLTKAETQAKYGW